MYRKSKVASLLEALDADAIGANSRKETRNRELHLPPVSVYRWWARRTASTSGAILSVLERSRDSRLVVVDPFSGGGVIPHVAASRGHQVYAQDLNPWAVAGLHTSFNLPPEEDLRKGERQLADAIRDLLVEAYGTRLVGGSNATVAHTLRVALSTCLDCGRAHRLFPHSLVTLFRRKERGSTQAFLACRRGHLFLGRANAPVECPTCGETTDPQDIYLRRRLVTCPDCGSTQNLEQRASHGKWRWEVVLVERVNGKQRELGPPMREEVLQADCRQWQATIPRGEIPDGKETAVLKRHGFERWADLYPMRQRAVIERLLGECDELDCGHRVKEALRIAVLGVAEMAGFASRWDRWYLKSYETMARHRFNFTTLTVEPNVWGTPLAGRGTFMRRVDLLVRARRWLDKSDAGNGVVRGPYLSDGARRRLGKNCSVMIVQGSSERMLMAASSADLILTDPPYHDDIQYDELSRLLRVWAGLSSEPLAGEAVANCVNGSSDYDSYTEQLGRIFRECKRVLRQDGRLVFTYANREPRAWVAVFQALQAAGFQACGYSITHTENETDHAKRHVRSCNLNLVLDLVPSGDGVEQWHVGRNPEASDEENFLHLVGATFLRVGCLKGDWQEAAVRELRESKFLKAVRPDLR